MEESANDDHQPMIAMPQSNMMVIEEAEDDDQAFANQRMCRRQNEDI